MLKIPNTISQGISLSFKNELQASSTSGCQMAGKCRWRTNLVTSLEKKELVTYSALVYSNFEEFD